MSTSNSSSNMEDANSDIEKSDTEESTNSDVENSDLKLEQQHFHHIVNAFRSYKSHCLNKLDTVRKQFKSIPARHRSWLSHLPYHYDKVQVGIEHNQEVINEILSFASSHIFENRQTPDVSTDCADNEAVSPYNMDKVVTTIKQFVRDWSLEGIEERKQCYGPLLHDLATLFPEPSTAIKVLVPGAGLGRLAYDIANQGFACQGNEFSLFMLLGSNFVLNRNLEQHSLRVYPWVTQYSNNLTNESQLTTVTFPDIECSQLQRDADFSMVAGDFLEVYTTPDEWDCVVSCFFLDTAHNPLDYLERMFHVLKPGGYLLNLGPLLYHFADMAGELSVELSYEDLKSCMKTMGFELIREKFNLPCRYTQNPNSMLKYQYDCVSFVARK